MTSHLNGTATGPTIPASAETLLRFQIGRGADEPERDDARVYLLAAPTEKLQRAFRSGLLSRGLRHPDNAEIVSAIALALDEMRASGAMSAEDFDRQFTFLERYEALEPWDSEKDGPIPRERRIILAGFARLVGWASEHAPYVQELEQKRLRFQAEYPHVACGVALRGVEHDDTITVDVVSHEATPATLAQIADEDKSAIGQYWLLQFALSAAQKKTSVSPPPSPTIPPTTRKAGGRRRSGRAGARSAATTNGMSSTSATLDT